MHPTNDAFRSHIRQLIADDALPEALQQLRNLLQNSPQLSEAILQAARLSDVSRQIRLGLINHQEANLTKNQIRAGLLDLLDDIELQDAKPAIQEEIKAAISISNSKNIVVGSTITAGGNVHIGDSNTTQNAEKIYNIDKIDKADFY